MVYKCFDKKSASLADKSLSGSGVKSEYYAKPTISRTIIKNWKTKIILIIILKTISEVLIV